MSNKKQTSVDWLENRLIESGISFLSEEIDFINQAKEMEKQQIKVAFISGEHQQGFQGEAEQYYKETYEQ